MRIITDPTLQAIDRIETVLRRISQSLCKHFEWEPIPGNPKMERCLHCKIDRSYVEPGFVSS